VELILLGLVAYVIGTIFRRLRTKQRLEVARQAYARALARLSEDPDDNARRLFALDCGQHYAALARQAAGNRGVAIFDEVALQNDLTARLGKKVSIAQSDSATDRLSLLERLSQLRIQGALTDEEFEREKQQLLGAVD
jgi:2-keto-3-deoxy-galactonokinase